MEKTFLFYDLETTGLNKAFDQILQFAAIRTDLSLNELERYEINVQLAPDVIPSPTALLIHRIPFSEMLSGEIEPTAITKIHALLNTPGTISLGYNTLNFDDEFLRFSFYRNLLSPYTHQFEQGCGRADLYPMIVFYYLYKNDLLQWPAQKEKISLKLEHLNAANQLTTGQAHQALSDVETTIALAKRCQQDAAMWDYLLQLFDKNKTMQQLSKLALHTTALLIDPALGAAQNFQCPVLLLGTHHHYANKIVWLRLDNISFETIATDKNPEATWAYYCKPGQDHFILPLTERYQKLSAAQQSMQQQNLNFIQQHPEFLTAISEYYLNFTYPIIPHLDSAAALYDIPFPNFLEKKLCAEFHQAAPADKAAILPKLTNPTLQELAIRLMGRFYPQHLPTQYQSIYAEYLQRSYYSDPRHPLLDYRGHSKLTAQSALQEIEALQKKSLSAADQLLLADLNHYLTEQCSHDFSFS